MYSLHADALPLPADIQERIIALVFRVGAHLLAARRRGSAPWNGLS